MSKDSTIRDLEAHIKALQDVLAELLEWNKELRERAEHWKKMCRDMERTQSEPEET